MKAFCEEFNALNVAEENQKLKEEIKTLKEVIYDLDGLECPKCGNYHRRGWTCSQCGYGK
jgi:ribosomal protein S27AE